MKKLFLFGILTGLMLLVVKGTQAYTFPIWELGNCRNYRECHLYCENPENQAACWSYSVYATQSVLGDETPEASLSELGVSFPIAELGNCENIAACKAYCSTIENAVACQTFKTRFESAHKLKILSKAQDELGCDSQDTCRTFCALEANRETCRNFAKRYHLKNQDKDRLLEAMQQELGCATRESCREFCEVQQNQELCQSVTKKFNAVTQNTVRDKLVEIAKEKLGCETLESCKAFCASPGNETQCRIFNQEFKERINATNKKGACTTISECREKCEANPDICPNFPKNPKSATRSAEVRKSNFSLDPLNKEIVKTKRPIGDPEEIPAPIEEATPTATAAENL